MSEKILYLFPDTNLFIQCKPLAELHWSEWSEFTEVHLIVCRPVTREIDDQKNRGNGRVAQRARSTYRLFAPLAEDEQDFLIIQNSKPVVKLFLEGSGQPSPELREVLDYDKTDDQIVGSLHRFLKDNPDADARLLTGDRGPMMAARSLGLSRVPVKETWLLPPEQNEVEKENTRLKQRVDELEKSEPRFKVELIDEKGKSIELLEADHLIYEPLSESTRDALLESLTNHFPMRTNFTPGEPADDEKGVTAREWLDRKNATGPPKDEDIAKYRDREYPNWIRQCRKVLSELHQELQREAGRPMFEFAVTNEGTRPGNDALVAIEATGNFKICPPPYRDEVDEDPEEELALPRPPRPPVGPKAANSLGATFGITRSAETANLIRRIMNPLHTQPIHFPLPTMPHEQRRDPNGFFYKPGRPSEPGESFSLECEQWRHSTGQELFLGEISFDTETSEIRGALRCEVHAANLSSPVIRQFPVRINVKRVCSNERAQELVGKLAGPKR